MKKPKNMKEAMKMYEASPADKKKDKAGAKKLMEKSKKPVKKGKK